jgi:hypothetical protein
MDKMQYTSTPTQTPDGWWYEESYNLYLFDSEHLIWNMELKTFSLHVGEIFWQEYKSYNILYHVIVYG